MFSFNVKGLSWRIIASKRLRKTILSYCLDPPRPLCDMRQKSTIQYETTTNRFDALSAIFSRDVTIIETF